MLSQYKWIIEMNRERGPRLYHNDIKEACCLMGCSGETNRCLWGEEINKGWVGSAQVFWRRGELPLCVFVCRFSVCLSRCLPEASFQQWRRSSAQVHFHSFTPSVSPFFPPLPPCSSLPSASLFIALFSSQCDIVYYDPPGWERGLCLKSF